MIRNLLSATLVLGLASAAGAQTVNTKLQGALDSAITGMNDGNEVGVVVVDKIKSAGVVIAFTRQKEAARTAKTGDGKPMIALSDALPAYPRPIALAVAREIAEMLVSEVTPSSEREYMKASIAARAWVELGGECSKLPVVESITGDKNDDLASSISIWCSNKSEMALYKIGEAKKTKSLLVLSEEAKSQAAKAKLDMDNKLFVQFVIAENDWRQMH